MRRWKAAFGCALGDVRRDGQAVADSAPAKKPGHKGAAKEAQLPRRSDQDRIAGFDRQDSAGREESRREGSRPSQKPAENDAAKPPRRSSRKARSASRLPWMASSRPRTRRELFVRPQEWSWLTVLKAVEHGAVVKQGDLVLALDTEKIDRPIADQGTELEYDLALKQAAETLRATGEIAPLEMKRTIAAAASPRKTGSGSRKWRSR